MKENKKNGFLPGWPPFEDFKRDIANLVDDKIDPLRRDLSTVKESLVSHIQTSNKNFADIKLTLANHITETNKDIALLSKEIALLNKRFDDLYEVIVKDIKNRS